MGQLTTRSFVPLYTRFLLVFLAALSGPLSAEEMTAGAPHVYGPVTYSETLKSVTSRIIDNRDFKLRDTMADIYYANSDAFLAGRSQNLRSGVLLKLPEYLTWNVKVATPISEPVEPEPVKQSKAPKPATTQNPPTQANTNKEATPALMLAPTLAPTPKPAQLPEVTATRPVPSVPIRLDPEPPSQPGTKEYAEIQFQLLKRQLEVVNAKLAADQEKSEMNSRLQGAYYLIAAVIFLVVLVLMINRAKPGIKTELPVVKKAPPTPQPKTQQKVKVASKATPRNKVSTTVKSVTDGPAIKPAPPVIPAAAPPEDDLTPASPEFVYDDPTPRAPSMAYDDMTPARPSLAYQDEPSTDTTEEKEEEDSNVSDIHEVIHDISGRFKGMSDDKDASNLALARVYMDLGDYKQAKPLLTAVYKSVTPEYAKQADDMIHELLQSKIFASSFNEIIGDVGNDDYSLVAKQLDDMASDSDPLGDVSGSFLTEWDDDEANRELEMAQIYFELGDYNKCKQHLAIILGSGNSALMTEALALLNDIESKEANDDDMTTKSDAIPDGVGDQAVIKEITPPDKTYSKEQLGDLSSQFMAISSNKSATKLALAHVHFEMNEHSTALKLLKEVITSGDDDCTPDAEALIKKIGDSNQA